ncbi:LA_3751/LA_3752 family putative glycosyltransferase [Leptospira paudalimensis]
MRKEVLVFLLICFSGILIYKRISWDKGVSPLIQSDSQIKLYQTIEYKNHGINSHSCFVLDNSFDTQFEFYPFRYPWAFYSTNEAGNRTCVFQYPSFFSQFFSLLPIKYQFFNLLILLLYLVVCFILIFSLRFILNLKTLEYALFCGVFFLVGYGITSAFEFSESVPAHLFLSIWFFTILAIDFNKSLPNYLMVIFGFIGGISIFLRSESIIYIGITGLVFLYFNRTNFLVFVRKYFFLFLGLFSSICLLAYYNETQFGEIFGVRSKVSLIDFTRLNFTERFHLVKEFFVGNENRVGFLFYCFPSILFFLYSAFKINLSMIQKKVYTITVLSFVCIVLLSPYSSGGLYAGMRFTEFTYLLITIFVCITIESEKEVSKRRILVFLVLLQIFLGIYHVRKNIRNLDYIKKYHDIYQSKLEEFPEAPVLHLSTFDLLLISDSFLKKPHWIVNHQMKFEMMEEKLKEQKVSQFQVFVYDFVPPKDDNVTEDFYKEWINTKFEIKSKYYEKQRDEKIAGFRLMLWKMK